MKIFSLRLLFLAIVSFTLLLSPIVVRTEDTEEDVEEDAVINDEGANLNEENVENQTAAETEADEETAEEKITSSPFVKSNILFIQPESSTDLPAGKLVKLLVNFQNNGSSSFMVDSIDGSFRYPQDFSFYIQNFSIFDYNKIVESNREATFQYLFTPSETFSSRQFGLTINLRYRNAEGKYFVNTVFNDTVNIVEPDEGLDGETFFLYIFFAAIVVLLLVGLQQVFTVFKKKGKGSKSNVSAQKLSNGNSTSSGDVDYQWIPKEHLQTNQSPKVSPRQRKVKNGGATSASGNSSNDE